MKASLMGLPDFQRGGAWPPSVRTEGVLLSQITNETPILICHPPPRGWSTIRGPLALSQRKAGATVGQYAPNPPGDTRATKDGTMGCNTER